MRNSLAVRAYSQAIAILNQAYIAKAVYSDMEEVYLSLYSVDKKCIIEEQVGTNAKRRLVRIYAIELIKAVRNTIGFDLVPKSIDKDNAFWTADDIILRISDDKVFDHFHLFRSMLNAIFGVSLAIINLWFNEQPKRKDVYAILNDFYGILIDDDQEDEIVDHLWFSERFEEFLDDPEKSLIRIESF